MNLIKGRSQRERPVLKFKQHESLQHQSVEVHQLHQQLNIHQQSTNA